MEQPIQDQTPATGVAQPSTEVKKKRRYGNTEGLQDEIQKFPINCIVEDVVIEKAEYLPSGVNEETKKPYVAKLQIKFKKTLTGGVAFAEDNIYAIDEADPYYAGDEKKIDKAYDNFNIRMLHYLTKFGMAKADWTAKVAAVNDDFETVARLFAETLNGINDKRPFYLKAWSNNKGWFQTPTFVPFLALMSDGQHSLKFTDWENSKIAEREAAAVQGGAIVDSGTVTSNVPAGGASSLDEVNV